MVTPKHIGSTPRTSSWEGNPSGPGEPPWDSTEGVRPLPTQKEMDLRAGERIVSTTAHAAAALLEKSALDDQDPCSRHVEPPQLHEIQLSQAISLKRIADALSGEGIGFEQMAFLMGQSFENGRRAQ